MIPPDMSQPRHSRLIRAASERRLARRVGAGGGPYAVSLSSIGADKPDGTGPVVGLRRLEQRLNGIAGLNVLHLRAGYFMENTLLQVWPIQTLGFSAGPLDPDLKIPMIATRDIGMAAAAALLALEFSGQQSRELLGQRDLNYSEVAESSGAPSASLIWSTAACPTTRSGRASQMGMSLNMADLLLEMCDALNSGYMRALEPRSARNTTPTSYEEFVAKEFVPRYQEQPAAA